MPKHRRFKQLHHVALMAWIRGYIHEFFKSVFKAVRNVTAKIVGFLVKKSKAEFSESKAALSKLNQANSAN